MTTKNAHFRPHCVDLSPGSFANADKAPADSTGRASRRYAHASQASLRKASRAPDYRHEARVGAVRMQTNTSEPRFQHFGKASLAVLMIASGIFWTNISNSNNSITPTAEIVRASIAPPAFFFDDAADALSTHHSSQANDEKTESPELIKSDSLVQNNDVPKTPSAITAVLDSLSDPAQQPERVAQFSEPVAMPAITQFPAAQSEPASLVALRENTLSPKDALTTIVAVAPGNTLSGILNKHGVKIDQMPKLLTDDIVTEHLSRLDIGQELEISQMPNGDFHSLRVRVGDDKRITIRRSANDFAIASIDLPVEKERVVTSGTIDQSLFLAAEQADLKQSTIMELADIFQWELDFARDIRKGDQFSLVYDRLYRDGSYIGDGDILAAEFVRGGKSYRAIRFTTDDGVTGYYSPDGKSKRRTFKRHPVDVVRITSKFDPNRLHPVLHKIRAHRGVDYGSPYGSPIYATADGKVIFAGSKNAYGNTVILKHGEKFSTLYAHMSKISDKSQVSTRVKQGDVIGYVGNSGRVTGTHLHYEFRVNGKQIDPLTKELPAAEPIAQKYLPELKALSEEMTEQIRSVLPTEVDTVAAVNGRATTQRVTSGNLAGN